MAISIVTQTKDGRRENENKREWVEEEDDDDNEKSR